jgi:uncharacterized protein (DUF1778 family)
MARATNNVHFRTLHETKQRIAEAAAERALQVWSHQNLVLTNDERDRFLEAIAHPSVPSEALKQGAARAQRAARSGVLSEY